MSQLLEVNAYGYNHRTGDLIQVEPRVLVPGNVARINWEFYVDPQIQGNSRFTVYMIDGSTFMTDWAGTASIQNWETPVYINVPA